MRMISVSWSRARTVLHLEDVSQSSSYFIGSFAEALIFLLNTKHNEELRMLLGLGRVAKEAGPGEETS